MTGRTRVLALAIALASCGKCGDPKPPDEAAPVAQEPPAPAPDKLIADVYLGGPNASWTKLQRGVGGAVGILPSTFSGVVCALAGFDPMTANEVEATAPVYGALAGDPADPAWALAMRLSDPRHARSVLADGDTSRFTSREIEGMTELVPKGAGAQAAVGLTRGGMLVVARRSEDLPTVGAYAARTLPTRPLPPGEAVIDVPRSAIAAVLEPKLAALWREARAMLLEHDERMRRERGRAPDFGDPKAIVTALDATVTRRLEVVRDLERIRVVLEVGEQDVKVTASMTPAAGSGPATKWRDAMATGDLGPILGLPVNAALAVTTRDTEAERAEQAKEIEAAVVSSLGERLAADDAKRVHAAVEDATKARGDAIAFGWMADDPSGLFVRAPVRDGGAAERAVRAALELTRAAPFKDMLRVKDLALAGQDVAGLGRAQVATVTRTPPKREGAARPVRLAGDGGAGDAGVRAAPTTTGVAWLVEAGVLHAAAGAEPTVTLRGTARPERTLGTDKRILDAIESLESHASTIVVAQPLRFDPKRADLPTSPLVFALGKRGGDAFAYLEIGDGVLRELARAQMGF